MRLAVQMVLFGLFLVSTALGQDSSDAAARQLFDEGIALGESGNWSEAAARFEQSLTLADRPATRINLVHAYVQLSRPLEVARHAVAFLSLPPEPHRAEARASAEVALRDAARELAVLGTQSVPAGTELLVDGEAPDLRDATRVFLQPGLHRLEARIPGAPSEVIELYLAAGQEVPWPRQGRADHVLATPVSVREEPALAPALPRVVPDLGDPASVEPAWRTRLSIATGTLGASLELTAVGLYALLLHRASELREADPYAPGFLTASDDYLRVSNAVTPVAIAGGVLMAQAMATGPRSARWGSRWTAVGALAGGAALVAAGIVLLARPPAHLGATQLDEPSRQAGALLVSSAGPLVSYGTSFWMHWQHSPQGVNLALGRP